MWENIDLKTDSCLHDGTRVDDPPPCVMAYPGWLTCASWALDLVNILSHRLHTCFLIDGATRGAEPIVFPK